MDYLTEIVIAHFDLPRDIARAATDISFGLPASAGSYLKRHELDLQTLEDLTVTMILGTFTQLKSDYVARRQPLRRSAAGDSAAPALQRNDSVAAKD